jgi:hypothetical protein
MKIDSTYKCSTCGCWHVDHNCKEWIQTKKDLAILAQELHNVEINTMRRLGYLENNETS